MPKLGPIFLLASAIITLLCFGVLCYLMRSVNPKPIPENARRSSSNILYTEELSQNGNLEYGLEKLPENATINTTALYIKSDIRHSPGDDIVVPPVSPNGSNKSRVDGENINSPNQTNSLLSHIKGQRRSIRDDDDLNLIKIPNSLILNLRDDNGPKIIIQLGTESKNRKRSSSNRKIKNKTIVVLEVNDSILLNVIGNAVDLHNLNDVESIVDLSNDLMNSTNITEENLAYNDNSQLNSSLLNPNENSTVDGLEYKPTNMSTEKFNIIVTEPIASVMKLDKTAVPNDLVVDLLQGETLKDVPPRNKNMYETVT